MMLHLPSESSFCHSVGLMFIVELPRNEKFHPVVDAMTPVQELPQPMSSGVLVSPATAAIRLSHSFLLVFARQRAPCDRAQSTADAIDPASESEHCPAPLPFLMVG